MVISLNECLQTKTRCANENNNTSDDNEVTRSPSLSSSAFYSHALGSLLRGTGGLSVLSGLHCSHPLLYDLHWHPSPSSTPPTCASCSSTSPVLRALGLASDTRCFAAVLAGADGIRGTQMTQSQPSASLAFALPQSYLHRIRLCLALYPCQQ